MSMYADYVFETRGIHSIETDYGFATYRIIGSECYIEDIYVKKEKRQDGFGSKMADEVVKMAKENGCDTLYGTINCQFNDPTTSLKSCLAYGFRIEKSLNDIILLKMEI